MPRRRSPHVQPTPRAVWQLTSNKHRAIEAARGKHGIKDAMDEMIILSGVRMLVGEWVPFGSNQVTSTHRLAPLYTPQT